MSVLERISAILLIIIGIVIVTHKIVEPLYHDGTGTSPLWAQIDMAMALAVVLGVYHGYRRLRAADSGQPDAPLTREYLASNVQFYGFLMIGVWFFWNWFNVLNPEFKAIERATQQVFWAIIDTVLPLLSILLGIRLLRGIES
ncbi:MAG: hypothetical protein F4Z15_11835 [Gammaproteobacteria bacterium]|nr:hypothetical protein [Gammaproteobacteria bacterium]MYD76390.1 hypothetical protein [Gammaproteobacteria bacterium]MYJ52953.1 hypothetical protein [Gammaproteobacteria bacterium]